jgi:ATPase family associated with various cellular activities (AAA)
MRRYALQRCHDDEMRDFAAAQRLSREVAILGGRLADLVARLAVPQDNVLAGGQAFLASMFDAWAEGKSVAEFAGSAFERKPPGPPHPLDRLAESLALTPFETNVILLAGMPEEHEGYASILRTLNPRGEGRASVGLAAQLFARDWRERVVLRDLLHTGAMVRSGLCMLAGEAGFFEKNLILAPGLWPVLGDLDVWPPDLAPLRLSAAASGLEEWLDSTAVQRAVRALGRSEPSMILITADSEAIATHRAATLAARAGIRAVAFELSASTPAGVGQLALLHALARGAVPIFRIARTDNGAAIPIPDLAGFPASVIVCARGGMSALPSERPVIGIAADPLSARARQRLWRETLPELAAQASTLAARYLVEPSAAKQIAGDVRAMASLDGGAMDLRTVSESVRARCNFSLASGIKLVHPSARWDQLILPTERKAQLTEALQRLVLQAKVLEHWKFLEGRPGARGVRILLSGPPGTGKTLSAEVMAQALGMDLLVADISRIVSKWLGETEKHLAEIFDAAERAQSILLFDEADALFGKRTEVSDAHDRYANLETAYLLSRLERFEGLAMLSTNLKQNIDPAFLRRLEFVIDFDEPSAAERESLWRCHLPQTAPLSDDVNLKELATLYPIVGGLIRNASVAAGFLAAAEETPITRNHLIGAIRREYEKSGKAFPGVPAGASHNSR